MNKKNYIIIIVAIVVITTLVIVYNVYQRNMSHITNTKGGVVAIVKPTNIKSTISAWKAEGLDVSDNQGVYYQMIDATDGGKYDVNGTNVELYVFKDNAKAQDMKDSYFKMIDTDTVFIQENLLIDIHSNDASVTNAILEPFKD